MSIFIFICVICKKEELCIKKLYTAFVKMYFITNAEEFPIYADSLVEAAKARGVTK